MPIRDRLRRLLSLEKPASPSAERVKPTPAPTPAPVTPTARPEHTLALYKYDACPYCRRVMQVVDRLGLQDTIEYRDTRRDPKWRGDLQDRTGRTQVPCLFIDGEAMFESADIGDWLQNNYG
jgi:glutaredoxin 3